MSLDLDQCLQAQLAAQGWYKATRVLQALRSGQDEVTRKPLIALMGMAQKSASTSVGSQGVVPVPKELQESLDEHKPAASKSEFMGRL